LGADPITTRATVISAERTTSASATTAGGSEIVENLLLARTLMVERRADPLKRRCVVARQRNTV